MSAVRRALMSGSVFLLALATGHVMQHGSAIADRFAQTEGVPVPVDQDPRGDTLDLGMIEDTNAGPDLPLDPRRRDSVDLPSPLRAAPTIGINLPGRLSDQNARSEFGFSCEINAVATPGLAAMVALELTAPCYAGAVVTVSHNAIRASYRTSAEGRLQIEMPAFETNAAFRLRFGDGVETVIDTTVPDAADFDRVALVWQGDQPLGLHAYEFGAQSGDSGHVHVGQPYVASRATNLGRGFLNRLGEGGAEDWRSEVFSFPSGATRQTGSVAMIVTAEITESHCGERLRARTLSQISGQSTEMPVEIVLTLPDCSAKGDVLELKNLVAPLKVAQK